MRLGRRLAVAAAAALAVAPTALAEPAKTGYPDSMAATGDSISRAFNTSLVPFIDAPWNSWSTGSRTVVRSHYRRIVAVNGRILGKNFNDAWSGAEMSDLERQISTVNTQRVEYVTILIGANDACASSQARMTPVSIFRAQFEAAMTRLSVGSPNARIYVVSIPDIYRLWLVLRGNRAARVTWNLLRICQSLLARPASDAPADVARRRRVRQRVIEYNAQLASVCAQYVHCRFDRNAVFGYPYQPRHVSRRDYFHPSLEGQTTLAEISWRAGFDFTDQVAPVSAATTQSVGGGTTVSLTAWDNVGVAGIEYRVADGRYRRYTGPIVVAVGMTVTYRAVDVNGNVEASHSLTG